VTQTRWLLLGLSVAIIGSACKREEAHDEAPPAPSPPSEAVLTTPTTVDTVASGWDSPEAARLSGVQYTAPIQIFGALGVTLPDEYFDSIGPGHKIGTFVDGRYRGADLVSARWRTSEPCKGEGCDDPAYFRFVRVGDQLVFLRQNSDGGDYFERQKAKWRLWTGAFAAAGLSLAPDSQFAVQAFLAPSTMLHGSENFRLVSRRCNGDSLKIAFRHPVFHEIRFDGQLFHVTRPDGTCLTFEYVPYFSEKEIVWDSPPKEPNTSGYSWKTDATYGRPEVRYDPFVAAAVVQIDRDTKVAGRTPRGEPVYELKDPNHALLREFYKDYEADVAKAGEPDENAAPGLRPPARSYEQFVAARPIFLWRDPFGRLMRFTSNDFLPVYMAEPVIYLYPTAALKVHVEAKPRYSIKASIPRYRSGWDVSALPSGELTGVIDRKTYSYLFWEGLSSISPMRQEGFVIPQAEVARFFEWILPRLGLNERESKDFQEAWLPRFHDAPYYFITFLPRETIDRLAPLVVTPKPDAVIRVLMDFRPLRARESITAPDLPAPPARRGFTVVEWGGLLRR
jgi:hypothetical protein